MTATKKKEEEHPDDRIDHVRRYIQKETSALSFVEDGPNGIGIKAASDQVEGTLLQSCPVTAMALEPSRRQTHCGFCSRAIDPTNNSACSGCHIIVCCDKCRQLLAWHVSSGECAFFQSLVEVVAKESLDSCLLLTIRLMFRQWYDAQHLDDESKNAPAPIDWKLFQSLYKSPSQQDQDCISLLLSSICQRMKIPGEPLTKISFDEVVGRVLGCSHAITDVRLPIGEQYLGRAIFLQHSFYNHACTPNAYLSCSTNNDGLVARVHLLRQVGQQEEITLSYLPLSGLSKTERHAKLQESYHFSCACNACLKDAHQDCLKLSENAYVESLRQVQFACHADLLCNPDKDALESILATLFMLKRGLENQGIPESHEVSTELHRLLAKGYALNGQTQKAIEENEAFFSALVPTCSLFDPVTEAKQRIEYTKLLENDDDQRRQLTLAYDGAKAALGSDQSLFKAFGVIIFRASRLRRLIGWIERSQICKFSRRFWGG